MPLLSAILEGGMLGLHLAPGAVIAGKYAIIRVLGEGGMGVVYEATHLKLRQRVAVKMLRQELLANAVIVSRFEREARAAAQLRSRHTVRVMDVDVTTEGQPYLVLELLDGLDLETELHARHQLPHEEAVDYVLQACAAMMEAHALGIVHRDLKPANLFLDSNDGSRVLKVLDFGISKSHADTDSKLTRPDTVVGTALYMSPEQVRASEHVDARTDIWSLGIILYELLSGRTPWKGTLTQLAACIVADDPPDLLAQCDIPRELAVVIGRALQRNTAQRFPNVRELAVALGPFAAKNGAGRLIADGLSSRASLPSLPTLAAPLTDPSGAPPTEVSAFTPPRPPGEGTAPGWSNHATGKSKGMLAPMLAAFAIGIVVLGGGAFAWVRHTKATSAPPSAVVVPPAVSPPAVLALPSAVVAAPSVAPSASSPNAAPKPAPSNSPSATPVASVAPAESAARPRPPPRGTGKPGAAPPPSAKPTSTSDAIPLHL